MDYICAAELLKQPEEIQKTLKNWMKDKYIKGDLAATNHGEIEVVIVLEGFSDENGRKGYYCITQHKKTPMWVAEYPDWLIPLFRETQLRKFAEEKTGCVFDITIEERNLQDTKWTYKFDPYLYTGEGFEQEYSYTVEAEDLLQAWWKVAIKISEEI